jgi:thiol-disulfide isomerase/thioredoxin/outer membrane lipoprotein-sorting protein
MFGEFKAAFFAVSLLLGLFLSAVFPLAVGAQTAPTTASPTEHNPDALTFLKEVCRRYEHLEFYHIEAVQEWRMDGEFSRSWQKSTKTAVVAPGNRYRFESHTSEPRWIQVSDGKNKWIYQPGPEEYTLLPTAESGPSRFKNFLFQFQQLNEAQDIPKDLSRWPISLRDAAFLPDEAIELDGKHVPCYVIEAQPRKAQPRVSSEITFWVDKETKAIRKVRESDTGPVISNAPFTDYVSDRIVLYPVADLNLTSVANGVFAFSPPAGAKLVKEFEDPMKAYRKEAVKNIVGQTVPAISLHGTNGKAVSLQSLEGKPVLLDFWATWCSPCLDSIPSLEKLYRETNSKGLVMLSIDEDEDPKSASDYLSDHPEPWPNFHTADDVSDALPHLGIPFFALADASGKIVFAGSDVEELRAAVAKLSPDFASLEKAAKP